MIVIGDIRSSHTKKWFAALKLNFENEGLVLYSDYRSDSFARVAILEPLIRFVAYLTLCIKVSVKILFSNSTFHVHSVSRYSIVSLLIPSARIYSYPYGSDIQQVAVKNYILRKLIIYNLKRGKMIVVSSENLKRSVKDLGITNEITVIPFGIPESYLSNAKRNFTVNNSNEFVIGCFKYCKYEIYGFDILLNLVLLLNRRLKVPVRLILIDCGPDIHRLKEEISSLSLSGVVKFLPPVSSSEKIFEYLQQVDMTIYCSRRESFGVCAVESMAAGKPCMASFVGGLREVIDDNENGYFIDPIDSEKTVAKVVRLFSDPNVYSKIAKLGVLTVENKFKWENNFEKFRIKFIRSSES